MSKMVSSNVARVAQAVSGGAGFVQPGTISSNRQRLYHRVNCTLSAAGLQVATLQFFNEARKPGITNLDQASTLSQNQAFSATSLRLQFIYGIDRDGNYLSNTRGLLNAYQANVAATPALTHIPRLMEKLRWFNSMATCKFKIQKDDVFEIPCLDALPWGGGMVNQVTADNHIEIPTAAGTWKDHQTILAAITNGAPITDNCFKFGPGALNILGGQSFSFQIDWPAQLNWLDNATPAGPYDNGAIPSAAGHFIAVLDGFFTN